MRGMIAPLFNVLFANSSPVYEVDAMSAQKWVSGSSKVYQRKFPLKKRLGEYKWDPEMQKQIPWDSYRHSFPGGKAGKWDAGVEIPAFAALIAGRRALTACNPMVGFLVLRSICPGREGRCV